MGSVTILITIFTNDVHLGAVLPDVNVAPPGQDQLQGLPSRCLGRLHIVHLGHQTLPAGCVVMRFVCPAPRRA